MTQAKQYIISIGYDESYVNSMSDEQADNMHEMLKSINEINCELRK